jgi:pyridoxine kinase
MLLTGYAPSAPAITAIRSIALDLQSRAATKPGSFFWILDPVMGDQGRLYVAEDVVPMYKELIKHADLILPNQFEAETLSRVTIVDLRTLREAVEVLHRVYDVPHVVVTSLTFPSSAAAVSSDGETETETIAVAGSSRTRDGAARLFIVHVPKLNCFFSGTGDMFAALMVVRMREAAIKAGLDTVGAWMSGDGVEATDLPLARAVEVVLAGMGGVLEETMQARDREMRGWEELNSKGGGEGEGDEEEHARRKYLAETKAAEVRVVRNVHLLRCPVVRRRAERVVV